MKMKFPENLCIFRNIFATSQTKKFSPQTLDFFEFFRHM